MKDDPIPTPIKQTVSVVNSFLLFASLGMLGFIGHGTFQNSVRLESLVASQITRSEFERKLEALRLDQTKVQERLNELSLEVARMRVANRQP